MPIHIHVYTQLQLEINTYQTLIYTYYLPVTVSSKLMHLFIITSGKLMHLFIITVLGDTEWLGNLPVVIQLGSARETQVGWFQCFSSLPSVASSLSMSWVPAPFETYVSRLPIILQADLHSNILLVISELVSLVCNQDPWLTQSQIQL